MRTSQLDEDIELQQLVDEESEIQREIKGGLTTENLLEISQIFQNIQTQMEYLQEIIGVKEEISTNQNAKKKNPIIKKWVTSNMFLLTIFWQLTQLAIVGFCEIFYKEEIITYVAIVSGSIFQSIELIFILVISIKLVKQLTHRTASGWFLVQSYLCSIVLFSGIYTLLYQISTSSFYGIHSNEIFELYSIFLYFSTTTMSTVGYGDIYPTQWYSQVFVLFEALLSVVYTTVIFAKGINYFMGSRKKTSKTHDI